MEDLAAHVREGKITRLPKIYAVLEKLDPGVYLSGAGPYAQGVFSLMCNEVVIGAAMPLYLKIRSMCDGN